MEEIILKVKVPTKFYQSLSNNTGLWYELPEQTIRELVLFKLKGLHTGIKVEIISPIPPAEPINEQAQAICNGIHNQKEQPSD
jgi:hypothetical protein